MFYGSETSGGNTYNAMNFICVRLSVFSFLFIALDVWLKVCSTRHEPRRRREKLSSDCRTSLYVATKAQCQTFFGCLS